MQHVEDDGPAGISPQLRDEIATVCKASAVLNDRQHNLAIRVVACVRDVVKQRWSALLAEARRRVQPTLYAYASDGWGTWLRKTERVQLGSWVTQREGRVRAEFLMERAVLKTIDETERIQVAMLFAPPRPLSDGKDGWRIWNAAVHFADMLRDHLPSGIVVNWYLQDGLHANQFQRWMRSRHEMVYDLNEDLAEADPVIREKDWTYSIRCVSHCASGSIKWALAQYTTNEVLDNVFIAISALQNSSSELMKVVPLFVRTRVVFEEADDEFAERERQWRALGVPEHVLPAILRVSPCWIPERKVLSVSQDLEDEPTAAVLVENCLMFFLRWRKWSLTRWAGVRPAAQLLVCSLLIGVSYLVELVLKGEDCVAEKVRGFHRLDGRARLFACLAATFTGVVHTFETEMLEDDRFLRHAGGCWKGIVGRCGDLFDMEETTWQALADIVDRSDIDARGLRSSALHCAFTCIAYLYTTLFKCTTELPLSLTQGDIEARLDDLCRLPLQSDPIARKIQILLGVGHSRQDIVRALLLIRDAPCSTGMVEKAHAAGALTRRVHQRYSTVRLAMHSMLVQVAPLFHKTRRDNRIDALHRKLAALEARKVSGRPKDLFVKRLLATVPTLARSTDTQRQLRIELIKRSAELFNALSAEEMFWLRRDAAEWKFEKEEHLRQQKLAVQQQIDEFSRPPPLPQARCAGVRNVADEVRFTEDELAQFNEYEHRMNDLGSEVSDLAEAMTAPAMPPADVRVAVEEYSKRFVDHTTAIPEWCRIVCDHRQHFLKGAIGTTSGHDGSFPQELFLVCLAFQQPSGSLVLMRVHRSPLQWPAVEAAGVPTGWAHALRAERYVPHYEFFDEKTAPFDESEQLWVFPELFWEDGALLVPGDPVLLEEFVAELPTAASGSRRPRAPGKRRREADVSDAKAKVLEMFPWLTADLVEEALAEADMEEAPLDRDGGPVTTSETPDRVDEQGMDDLVGKAMDRLLGMRMAYAEEDGDEDLCIHFYSRIAGGRWTAANRGVIADSSIAYSRKHAAAWCVRYCWPKQKGFAFATYGERNSVELSKEWARRGEYFMQVWIDAGSPEDFTYTDAHVEEYTEPMSFLEWACGVETDSETMSRIMELRRKRPVRRGG